MKKIIILILLFSLGACSNNDTWQIMNDFVESENIMLYYRADNDANIASFRYPIKTVVGTNIEQTPQDEFNEMVNDLTSEFKNNIFDIMQASTLEPVDSSNIDENNVLMFLRNVDNDGMIYFYNDGNVKEICADGTRNYYHLNDDDHNLLVSMIDEYITKVHDLRERILG